MGSLNNLNARDVADMPQFFSASDCSPVNSCPFMNYLNNRGHIQRTAGCIRSTSIPVPSRQQGKDDMRRLAILSLLLLPLGISEGSAHPGGLNSEGCHNNRKTGDYHCHGGGAASGQATSPRRSFLAAPTASAFRNCAEARAAGAAPVRRGDPGYGPHLDRDNDGVGCEPYRGR